MLRAIRAITHFPKWMLDHVDRSQPSPEERVAVVEEVQRLLRLLPEPLRQIVVWKLEGFTNAEISCMIDRTVRSVEIKLQLIRKHLEGELGRIDPNRKFALPRNERRAAGKRRATLRPLIHRVFYYGVILLVRL